MADINWARKQAEAIVSYLPADQAAAIDYVASALQKVADECMEIANTVSRHNELLSHQQITQDSSMKSMSRSVGAARVGREINVKFPKEKK